MNSGGTQCLNEGLMFLSTVYQLVQLLLGRGGSIFPEHPLSTPGHATLIKLLHRLWRAPVKRESVSDGHL